jgi:hypothetical protein
MANDKWDANAANTVRDMLKHEGELLNHRMTWLVTLQGLLFAALGFGWQTNAVLIGIISALGIAASVSTYVVVIVGSLATQTLITGWDTNKPSDYNGPDVIGYRGPRGIGLFFRPWRILPFFFMAAWIAVFVVNFLSRRKSPCS